MRGYSSGSSNRRRLGHQLRHGARWRAEPDARPAEKLHEAFRILPFTNGIRKIPMAGFETMPIAVSVWRDHATDTRLRGRGKIPVFRKALTNYRDDPWVMW
jgi:hypothetical protein